MLNAKTLGPGEEQHECFRLWIIKERGYRYIYRDQDGKLSSCVKPTLDECRAARVAWTAKRQK